MKENDYSARQIAVEMNRRQTNSEFVWSCQVTGFLGIIRIHILFLFVAMVFCSVTGTAKAKELSVLAFGDSITQGYKSNGQGASWGITSPPHGARVGGYEPYLETYFQNDSRALGNSALVYNWGYGGEQTYQGTSRLRNILASRAGVYDYCLLMEGANDLYAGVSASTTAFNLGLMVDNCRSSGAVPILATITKNWNTPAGYLIPEKYNPAIVAKATEKQVLLADQYAMSQQYWYSVFTPDHLHMNDLGDQKMAGVWFETLLQDDRFKVRVPVGALELLLLH